MRSKAIVMFVLGTLCAYPALAQEADDSDEGMIELQGSPFEAENAESQAAPSRDHEEAMEVGVAVSMPEPALDLARGCLDESVVRDTSWCANPSQTPDHVLICYEERDGNICPVVFPRHHTLLPNHPVRVIVRHRAEWAAAITLGGIQGLYTPPVDSNTAGQSESFQSRRTSAAFEEQRMALSTAIFGPRLTGDANVTIVMTQASEQQATTTTELIVESTYSGALRVGIGMVFGGATSRTYEVQLLPGSLQNEIVATGGGDVDLEIVVGFAPFIEAFYGGRAYHDGAHLSSFPFGFSPYIGIAVVGTTATGVDALTAFYFGLEWEPVRGVSAALALVARRVDRLQPGLEVGDPAVRGGGVTRNGYELGWGLVISFSPDVLQVAGVIR